MKTIRSMLKHLFLAVPLMLIVSCNSQPPSTLIPHRCENGKFGYVDEFDLPAENLPEVWAILDLMQKNADKHAFEEMVHSKDLNVPPEVLADPRTQHLLHGGAGLDRVGSIVIDAIIAQPQTVEQVVAAQLLVEPVRVLGPAVIYGLVNKHGVTP